MQTVVELSRLRHNVRRIKAKTGNGFCAVVKAQAYGHGATVAHAVENLSDCFFVATFDEATELIYGGIRKPVLVLGGDISPYLTHRNNLIVPTVSDARQLSALINAGYKNFSVAVNTGMNRYGANESELNKIVDICKAENTPPLTVYSHIYDGLYSAPEQAKEFDRLTTAPILRGCRHLYSSCALGIVGNKYDLTRAGLAMYGYSDETDMCMRVRAKITAINRVPYGSHIGYGNKTLDRDRLVATVSCGYADGLRRCDGLYMRVRGVKCEVLAICMDACMIDVTDAPCRPCEFAYLIYDKSDALFLADKYNTIIYEVLTSFNGRAERIYL